MRASGWLAFVLRHGCLHKLHRFDSVAAGQPLLPGPVGPLPVPQPCRSTWRAARIASANFVTGCGTFRFPAVGGLFARPRLPLSCVSVCACASHQSTVLMSCAGRTHGRDPSRHRGTYRPSPVPSQCRTAKHSITRVASTVYAFLSCNWELETGAGAWGSGLELSQVLCRGWMSVDG